MRATNPYYVLTLLLASYVMNSLDRAIVAILLDPIGREFSLSDTQLGLLAGLAFAAFYATLGIPVAALADRTSRRRVLATSVLTWSVATMCCGLAGSFAWLLLARVGTAVGESGSTPASHSLIADYFPPHRLATAMAVFSLGAPLGTAFAGLWGGHGNDLWGWRTTIMLAGIPGLLLAPLVWFTIGESPRDNGAAPAAATATRRPFIESATQLLQRKSFRHLFLACALHSLAVHSTTTFNATFLIRSYGWNTSQAGQTMALLGILSGVGVIFGGVVADRLRQRTGDSRWLMWVPALATLLAVPFHTMAYLVTDAATVLVVLPVASLLGMMFFGPAFALGMSLAAPGTRAVVSSMLLFGMTLIGLGFGPLLVGTASDWLAPVAHAHSLQYALLLAPAVNIWAAIHFALAAIHLPASETGSRNTSIPAA
jgi:predicted MFS family arabinose efflux permease